GTATDLALGEDIAAVEGSRILYDPDFDDNLARPLADLGLVPGKMLTLASEDDDSTAVPVILSIAAQRPQGGAEQLPPPPPLAIEGFESLPEFGPLPDDAPDDAGSTAAAEAADAGSGANDLDDDGAIVLDADDDAVVALDDSDVDSVGHISDELHKRKLADASPPRDASSKRRALPGSEENDDDDVTMDD
ncbi:E1 ubiquitin-activating protein uba2, partial [Coemansia nantahalensis]